MDSTQVNLKSLADKNFIHRLFPWITGSIMSTILVLPWSYGALTLWLTFYGLWFIRGFRDRVLRPSLALRISYVWYGLAIYLFFGIGLGLIHGYKASYYEAFIPFLLAPIIVNGVLAAKPSPTFFWIGAAFSAIFAGLMASYQSLYLGIGRAFGAMNNIIIFGDLSVVMAMFSVFGLLYWSSNQSRYYFKIILLIGSILGVWASLLSGTKGGWLSILMILIMVVWISLKDIHPVRKFLCAIFSVGLIVFIATLAPSDLVVNRVKDGVIGAYTWFLAGNVTDGSVSIRLEKWYQAILMLIEMPLTGWNTQGAIAELQTRINSSGVPGIWIQAENDLLQAGINHGFPAIIVTIILYCSFIFSFVKIRKLNPDSSLSVGLSSVGILFVILMIEFGLSVNALGRNSFRHTFIIWEMLIFSLLLLELNSNKDKK